MSAFRRNEFRLRGQHNGLPAGRRAEHGRDARDGTRPHHARRGRNLPAWGFVVPGDRGRLSLDGTVVSAMVRSDRQGAGKVSHLQRLEPASAGMRTLMSLTIDRERLLAEI